ncbi:MAG TPA: hypothetical protein VMP12_04395 [Candidatus Sulfotelmatobacter sp.]|nr:hypothetical protein [Candidatus Sulfotelmatobacter sp.]
MQRAANIHRPPLFFIALVASFFAFGCTAAFGPGYTIDKQEIEVHFISAPEPTIHIEATYHLRNDGIRPLTTLELRLPGRRRFHFADPSVEWDGHAVTLGISPDNRRNSILSLSNPWMVSENRTLKLSVEYKQAAPNERTFSFAPDAFFLPSEGWSPQLMPARGAFAKGGVPPAKWQMTIRVPEGFLVHASGEKPKKSKSNGEQVIRYTQLLKDGYPFVIAGRYVSAQFKAAPETVMLWSRAPQDTDALRQSASGLVSAMKAYDGMFGKRVQNSRDLWLVECPVVQSCFSTTASYFTGLINEPGAKPTAEMASLDTVMVDLTKGAPDVVAAAGPSLASTWLGYGQNPGFYEQDPPLAALPAFAAVGGREAAGGPQVRTAAIRRALKTIPVDAQPGKPEPDEVVRAKSLLLFFALQDRYGQKAFAEALSHMLYARRRGGFDITDLISAFDQETHQNVGEFVRHWMKRSGVPQDFRSRYEGETSADAVAFQPKEATP